MRALALPCTGDGDDGPPRLSCSPNRKLRDKWALRAAVLLLHALFVGSLFLTDSFSLRKLRDDPWPAVMYLVLLAAAIFQYFFTSCSSPGYVVDAMVAVNGARVTFASASNIKQRQSAPGLGTLASTKDHGSLGRRSCKAEVSPWLGLVMELYPPGESIRSWSCIYCNIIQPPRSKHCHECHKCVLRFDHHCVWLGTCIGQGNHCRFWWYLFEETILCIWTGMLYLTFLRSNVQAWWKDFVVLILLSVLTFCLIFLILLLNFHSYLLFTNQTTYEIIRQRRIMYLRDVPRGVHLFSRGICRNVYSFCCSRESIYTMDTVPSMEELEFRARKYTCSDIVTCRCC